MKHTGVYTTYTSGGRPYGSYILAQTTEEAAVLARQRSIGETILSEPLDIEPMQDYRKLDDEDFIRHLSEVIHQAAFLTYIACSSKAITLDEALGDNSVLHSLAHLLSRSCPEGTGWDEYVKQVRSEFYALQDKVPGLFPVHCEKGWYLTVKIKPGSSVTVKNIVQGSDVYNYGPAKLTMCDCADPDCGITDDDQPCGYEQTIDEMARGKLDTEKDFVHIVNRDQEKQGKALIPVRGKVK